MNYIITKKYIVIVLLLIGIFSFKLDVKANCNDGIDNDGDGLVDWQYDLGCSSPTDEEISQTRNLDDNWTTYDPHPTKTKIFYVSDSSGNDDYNGLAPEWDGTNGPKKTIKAATSLMHDNSADWILLKRGDSWKNQNLGIGWEKSGFSKEYPLIFASYGNSKKRPLIKCRGGCFSSKYKSFVENISILGIEFYSYIKDPNNIEFNGQRSNFSWLSYGGNFLLEDNFFNFIQLNIQVVNQGDITIRNNILARAYSAESSHAQSLFTLTSVPLLIENNIFYHGGWNDDFRIILKDPETDYNVWKAVKNGNFDINLAKNLFQIENVNFSNVSNMDDVAQVLETAINNKVEIPDAVSVVFTLGKVFKISSDVFKSSSQYSIKSYTGDISGTAIDTNTWLNAEKYAVPNSTIFNRNMYLSKGYGNTIVRNNIDAYGASGGTQLRMGGILDNNLFLQNPISIVFGSSQNGNKSTSGVISNNVILGSRNIDTQLQGTGISLYSASLNGTDGPSLIENLDVYNNLIAHGTSVSKYNIKGINLEGDAPYHDLDIHDNVVYDWTSPSWDSTTDHRAFGFKINIMNESTNSFFRSNIIQQPNSGFVGDTKSNPPITFKKNIYYSIENNPPTNWASGWFNIAEMHSESFESWVNETNDTDSIMKKYSFTDPTRTIETYNKMIGGKAAFEDFILNALKQSKFNWNKDYTAPVINNWIREGYNMNLLPTTKCFDYSNQENCEAHNCNYCNDICQDKVCTIIRADVDKNLTINSIDALLTLRNSLGLNMSGTNWQTSSTTGDVNCDGNSNSIDAVLILKYSLGLDMNETGWCDN